MIVRLTYDDAKALLAVLMRRREGVDTDHHVCLRDGFWYATDGIRAARILSRAYGYPSGQERDYLVPRHVLKSVPHKGGLFLCTETGAYWIYTKGDHGLKQEMREGGCTGREPDGTAPDVFEGETLQSPYPDLERVIDHRLPGDPRTTRVRLTTETLRSIAEFARRNPDATGLELHMETVREGESGSNRPGDVVRALYARDYEGSEAGERVGVFMPARFWS